MAASLSIASQILLIMAPVNADETLTTRDSKEKVYAEDGLTYSYTLPDELETSEYKKGRVFTWRYDGQAIYNVTRQPVKEGQVVVPDVVYTGMEYDPDELR